MYIENFENFINESKIKPIDLKIIDEKITDKIINNKIKNYFVGRYQDDLFNLGDREIKDNNILIYLDTNDNNFLIDLDFYLKKSGYLLQNSFFTSFYYVKKELRKNINLLKQYHRYYIQLEKISINDTELKLKKSTNEENSDYFNEFYDYYEDYIKNKKSLYNQENYICKSYITLRYIGNYTEKIEKIPKVFYHVTTNNNYKRVIKNGLLPSIKIKQNNTLGKIYLFGNLDGIIYNNLYNYINYEIILRIDSSKLLKGTKFFKDPLIYDFDSHDNFTKSEAVYTYSRIPSNAISEINKDEILYLLYNETKFFNGNNLKEKILSIITYENFLEEMILSNKYYFKLNKKSGMLNITKKLLGLLKQYYKLDRISFSDIINNKINIDILK